VPTITEMPSVTLRFVSWNIDGVERALEAPSSARRMRAPLAVRVALKDLHRVLGSPDILALQETRIRAADAALIARLERAIPGYVCSHSLCRDSINVKFRGGRAYGVAIFVRAELGPQWLGQSDWDHEGRLVTFELPNLKLLVANVYAVNGTDKTYFDPESGEPIGDRHAFKREFQTRLLDYFQAARQRGLKLILLGDWNVSRAAIDTHPRLRTEAPHAEARKLLNEAFIPALDLEDAFRSRNPAWTTPSCRGR
jgi:exonuclease III